ncbi:MAG: DUF1702 family protein [Ignavibacteriae bacterium]|nr:DUF1702 family protein [Ignavibacteria bacterium]MBI3364788.1 DUF1702 family protein [Ignavibacteriota bacterium]
MTRRILSYFVGRTIERMRFPHQEEGGKAISDRVLALFRSGAMLGLRGETMEACRHESQKLPWNVRAFFNEGHAMGCAGLQACSLIRRNPEANAPKDYEIMRYVGYGFWNGVGAKFHVPGLPENGSYWNDVQSFSKYRLLMANGYGFSLVLFHGNFTDKIKNIVMNETDERRREAVLHGIGRVLWFLYLYNYASLKDVLDEHRKIAGPLAIGLGLAIAFTQVATPENILRSLEKFPDEHRVHLIRGAGIALQVHAQNDPECKKNVEQLIHGELCDWYEGAWSASRDAGEGKEWYSKYHELTKRFSISTVAKDFSHV